MVLALLGGLRQVFKDGKFPWLKNGDTWSIFPNMRNVFIMGSGNATFATSVLQHNEWLTPCDPASAPPPRAASYRV